MSWLFESLPESHKLIEPRNPGFEKETDREHGAGMIDLVRSPMQGEPRITSEDREVMQASVPTHARTIPKPVQMRTERLSDSRLLVRFQTIAVVDRPLERRIVKGGFRLPTLSQADRRRGVSPPCGPTPFECLSWA